MFQKGFLRVHHEYDGDGGLWALAMFREEGGTEEVPVGEWLQLQEGEVLCIGPVSLVCELTTTSYDEPAGNGDADLATAPAQPSGREEPADRPAAHPAPAPHPAPEPAAPPSRTPAAGGPRRPAPSTSPTQTGKTPARGPTRPRKPGK